MKFAALLLLSVTFACKYGPDSVCSTTGIWYKNKCALDNAGKSKSTKHVIHDQKCWDCDYNSGPVCAQSKEVFENECLLKFSGNQVANKLVVAEGVCKSCSSLRKVVVDAYSDYTDCKYQVPSDDNNVKITMCSTTYDAYSAEFYKFKRYHCKEGKGYGSSVSVKFLP